MLYIFLFQESDFDFVDKQHLQGIKVEDILSSQAILDDDEDLMNDQGSGPFMVESSGTTEIVSSTQFASSTKPGFPYTASPARNHTGDLGKQTSTVINCCCYLVQ